MYARWTMLQEIAIVLLWVETWNGSKFVCSMQEKMPTLHAYNK